MQPSSILKPRFKTGDRIDLTAKIRWCCIILNLSSITSDLILYTQFCDKSIVSYEWNIFNRFLIVSLALNMYNSGSHLFNNQKKVL